MTTRTMTADQVLGDRATKADRDKIDTAFHEAGHALAAVLLGGRIHNAVVASGRVVGIAGVTTYVHLPGEHQAAVTLAGPWCQARWIAGRRPTSRELYSVLRTTGHFDDKRLLASGGIATVDPTAEMLLERCWPSVVTLARKLFRDGEARQDDTLAALALTKATAVHGLAMIRSGSTPGTFTVTPAAV